VPPQQALEISPQEVLAGLLAQLQRDFGAVVLAASDGLSGSLRVDVRIPVGEARRIARERLRERGWLVVAESRACIGISSDLVSRASLLVRDVRDSLRARDERLAAARVGMVDLRATARMLRERRTGRRVAGGRPVAPESGTATLAR
jgi:hypothetical protein